MSRSLSQSHQAETTAHACSNTYDNVYALPFIDLEAVVRTVEMLRNAGDTQILDVFNRSDAVDD